jgi:hypothetical protein
MLKPSEHSPFRESLLSRLGNSKINHFGYGLVIVQSHQDIGWFEIAMDHSFLMGMLDGLANRDGEFQPLMCCQLHSVREFSDRNARRSKGSISISWKASCGRQRDRQM